MKTKKLGFGITALTLTLALTVTAYAASNNKEFREKVSMDGENNSVLSFDRTDVHNLPEGTVYQEEIFIDEDSSSVYVFEQ